MNLTVKEKYGWRTLVVESPASISVDTGNVVFEHEEEKLSVPMNQVRQLIVDSYGCRISVSCLNELKENDIGVVLCNSFHNPATIISSASNFTAENLLAQSRWSDESKSLLWQNITKQKIHNQASVLRKFYYDAHLLEKYETSVLPADSSNREALAAKVYFRELFGASFIRHSDDNENYALNYGYTILLSEFNRSIIAHGYSTVLGINHCNKKNSFNLSCDFMEPFRPFVDSIVFANMGREMDPAYKKELIAVLNAPAGYGNKRMKVMDAVDCFVVDCLKSMNRGKLFVREVRLAG